MIWGDTHLKHNDRIRKLNEWHRWFAWHPVQLTDGRWAWLCDLMRRGQYWHTPEAWWEWEYRPI